MEQAYSNARVYTDIQGLKQLQYESHTHSAGAKKEVAQQFEAILMQMVFSSMREANKAFASDDMFGSDQMEMYQDLFDKQLSLVMSNSGVGFANIIEKSIDQTEHAAPTGAKVSLDEPSATVSPMRAGAQKENSPIPIPPVQPAVTGAAPFTQPLQEAADKQPADSTEEGFVSRIWSSAKKAASLIGVSPAVLVAQAALETNWGKSIVSDGKQSTNNLFNIKADASWKQASTPMDTIEQKNGVLVKEKSRFRNYQSVNESFLDYVNFLKQNDRYSETLSKGANPEQFINGLQRAGYATDPNYADKILKILSSSSFKHIVTKFNGLP